MILNAESIKSPEILMEPQTFEQWLAELNAEAVKRGYPGSDKFWQDAGSEFWEVYYEEGSSPAAALTEAIA